jgi:cytidine deaminase
MKRTGRESRQRRGGDCGDGDKRSLKDLPMADVDNNTLLEMAKRAKAASSRAYCPYSKFPVGAAVLTDDGQIFEGCNVENASYGLTICAERNAMFQMVAGAKRRIIAVVIYTPTPIPSAPCGACRQVINEFGPDALMVSVCDGDGVLRKRLSELLPDAFGPGNLSNDAENKN